jgi:hypothetical protein
MHRLIPLIVGIIALFLMTQFAGFSFAKPPVVSTEKKAQKNLGSPDPEGWRDFKWGMTKEEAVLQGAASFRDAQGSERFGLPEVELFPGKQFWVELVIFSHIRLAEILIYMKPHRVCANEEYQGLLSDLRKKYGKEKETNDLGFPNSWFLSHVWIVQTTRIELNHACPKPGRSESSDQNFRLSIRYEKRRFIELWNR